MRARRLAIMVVLLVSAMTAAAGAGLAAQEGGDRVRITDPSRNLFGHSALLVSLGSDTLVVRLYGSDEQLALPYDSISKLDVYRGRRSDWLPAGVGLGVTGAVLGALAGSCHSSSEWFCGGGYTAIGVGLFGAIGFCVGAAIGRAFHHDIWKSVSLPPTAEHGPRVGVLPTSGGIALSLHF